MATVDTSQSSTPYNWHPAVHATHFGETLYFVMIRLREPLHRPVAEQVRDLLQTADVQFACEYSLFGWWDALLRVWLTPSSYRRFLRVLEDSVQHNVADFHGFTTTRMHYFWRGNDADLLASDTAILKAVAGHTADIASVVEHPDRTATDSWESLRGAGLIFQRPVTPDGGVKFYTSLERTSDVMSVQHEIGAIKRAMESTVLSTTGVRMTQRSTLYCGAGTLADYLVRCVADTYGDVLALAESFDKHLQATRLRPMTLLVANTDPCESDNVNDTHHLTLDDTTNAELLGLADARVLAKLPSEYRFEIHHLVVTACELANDDEAVRTMLLNILHATVINDHDKFQASLSFLFNFEPLFRDRLIRELAGIFGQDWLSDIRAECQDSNKWREHGDEMAMNMKKWTLGTYMFTALAACDFDRKCRGRFESQLGSNWSKEYESFLDLRNDVAHGRVHDKFQHLDVYDPVLTDFLRRAMNAAVFWRRCRNGRP
jgi:hypothetical protein